MPDSSGGNDRTAGQVDNNYEDRNPRHRLKPMRDIRSAS
jgi:hypothetical protein